MPYPPPIESIPDLIAAYLHAPADLARAVAGMSPEQLRASPVAGKWSTLQVACHLADATAVYADRIKRTIAMDKPLLMSYDESRYAAALAYSQRDLDEELALMRATRGQIARILRTLGSDAWDRVAVHSENGLVTLKHCVQMDALHVPHHVHFIMEKRRAMGLPT